MTIQDFNKIKPAPINQKGITQKIAEVMGGGLALLGFSYFMLYVLINFLMGCGEAFYQADGSYLMGQCAPFLPWEFFGPNW